MSEINANRTVLNGLAEDAFQAETAGPVDCVTLKQKVTRDLPYVTL